MACTFRYDADGRHPLMALIGENVRRHDTLYLRLALLFFLASLPEKLWLRRNEAEDPNKPR